MRYLVTGGCGFLGSNLATEVMKRGDELFLLDNLQRKGSADNLAWLKTQGQFRFYESDMRDRAQVESAVRDSKPDMIFHLAGQVAMTTSIADPRLDFETNVLGGINLLEAVRAIQPEAVVTYSSTNKVYGDLEELEYSEGRTRYHAPGYENGFDEKVRLDFRSPYGCSKGAMDQYMLDYSRVYGLKTMVFRHSSIFGGRQFSTFDQGWIGWFVLKALETRAGTLKEPFTISGNGKQVRDVLFASDLVDCYFSAIKNADACKGQAFNIGGGMGNSLSLLELFNFLNQELEIRMEYVQLPWRQSDQKVFVADLSKSKKLFDWQPRVDKASGLRQMISWVKSSGQYAGG